LNYLCSDSISTLKHLPFYISHFTSSISPFTSTIYHFTFSLTSIRHPVSPPGRYTESSEYLREPQSLLPILRFSFSPIHLHCLSTSSSIKHLVSRIQNPASSLTSRSLPRELRVPQRVSESITDSPILIFSDSFPLPIYFIQHQASSIENPESRIQSHLQVVTQRTQSISESHRVYHRFSNSHFQRFISIAHLLHPASGIHSHLQVVTQRAQSTSESHRVTG